jgi:glycosyltransferase involved in cell wall biosynthesis
MRIALVSQEYPPETAFGGIGTQNHAKAHGLASMGHELHVISHSTDSRKNEYLDGDVHVTRIPSFESELPLATDEARWITYSAKVAAAVATLHAREPLDLVEFADWGSEGYVHLLNRAAWNHIPTAIQLHGPVVMFAHAIGWPDPSSEFFRVAREMEATCLRRADAVFSSSRCSAEWCERFHGLDSSRVPVIHTGVDVDVFRPLDVPKDPHPTIVFVGKIERNKGVELLVAAACELVKGIPNLRLRMLGRGNPELAIQLQRQAREAGCPQMLHLAGFVNQSQLPEQLSRAHVFAAPSQYEGGPGFVYLEAMACGLPVIGCSGSGASEAITHGETGLLIPPNDLHELVQALRSLLTNNELRTKLGRRAVEHVARECDRRSCLRQLEEFYALVAARLREEATT